MHSGESIDSPESFDPFTRLNRSNDPSVNIFIILSFCIFPIKIAALLPQISKNPLFKDVCVWW